MTPDTGVPWTTIVAVAVPAFAAFGALLVFFVKRLLIAERERTTRLEKQMDEQGKAYERLRDRWDAFLSEYLKIDSTRGAKIDALFRVVDQMEETVRDVKPMVRAKVDDAFARACSELRLFVRDQLREERKNG